MLGGVLPWMERACSPCDIIHNLRCGGATGLCYVLQRYLRLHDEHVMIIWSSTLSPLLWCLERAQHVARTSWLGKRASLNLLIVDFTKVCTVARDLRSDFRCQSLSSRVTPHSGTFVSIFPGFTYPTSHLSLLHHFLPICHMTREQLFRPRSRGEDYRCTHTSHGRTSNSRFSFARRLKAMQSCPANNPSLPSRTACRAQGSPAPSTSPPAPQYARCSALHPLCPRAHSPICDGARSSPHA